MYFCSRPPKKPKPPPALAAVFSACVVQTLAMKQVQVLYRYSGTEPFEIGHADLETWRQNSVGEQDDLGSKTALSTGNFECCESSGDKVVLCQEGPMARAMTLMWLNENEVA